MTEMGQTVEARPVRDGFTGWLTRYPVLSGFLLMFLCTWPVDLWAAASSRGWVSHPIPALLPILVGYGFVVAAVAMTAIIDGRAGVGALLRRFLVWRVGVFWYVVVLAGPLVVDVAGIALDALVSGTVPAFGQPIASRIFGPSVVLWAALPVFFLVGVLSNGEEIGWRGYALVRLQSRHSALLASLVVGIVSAVWHIPKFLTAGSAQDYSFWLFLIDSVAKAIIFSWVFNGTSGSLLIVTVLHAALNTSAVFMPTVTGENNVLMITVGLHVLIALLVVIVAGPARLMRSDPTRRVGGGGGPGAERAHGDRPENGAGGEQEEGELPADGVGEQRDELDADDGEGEPEGGLRGQGGTDVAGVGHLGQGGGDHAGVGDHRGTPDRAEHGQRGRPGRERDRGQQAACSAGDQRGDRGR